MKQSGTQFCCYFLTTYIANVAPFHNDYSFDYLLPSRFSTIISSTSGECPAVRIVTTLLLCQSYIDHQQIFGMPYQIQLKHEWTLLLRPSSSDFIPICSISSQIWTLRHGRSTSSLPSTTTNRGSEEAKPVKLNDLPHPLLLVHCYASFIHILISTLFKKPEIGPFMIISYPINSRVDSCSYINQYEYYC